jgi:hypothetical protein
VFPFKVKPKLSVHHLEKPLFRHYSDGEGAFDGRGRIAVIEAG